MTSDFIWNNATREPANIDAPILVWTNNDKLVVFKDTKTCLNGDTKHPISNWKYMVDKYNIKYWVYQSFVISKKI